jgi:hypothetical protein
MISNIRISHFVLALAVGITATACGGSDDEETAQEQAAEEAPPQSATSPQPDPSTGSVPLTMADIEAYERGMQKEKQILEELVTKVASAKNDQEKLNLMMQAMEDQTVDDGAQAAGMSVDRYKDLRNRMDQVLGANSSSIMGSALRQQAKLSEAQIDTLAAQGLPAERIAEMRQSMKQMQEQYDTQEKASLEQVSPDARGIFTQRVLRLDSLRLTTAGLRVKVAS